MGRFVTFFLLTSALVLPQRSGSSLDGKYTVFGRVVDGMAAVEAIGQTPVNGETPVTRVELKTVRIIRPWRLWPCRGPAEAGHYVLHILDLELGIGREAAQSLKSQRSV